MSRTVRCINSRLRTIKLSSSSAPASRAYGNSAYTPPPRDQGYDPSSSSHNRHPRSSSSSSSSSSSFGIRAPMANQQYYRHPDRETHDWQKKPAWERSNRYSIGPPEEHFERHLNGVFPGLEFPPELAQRVLTHGSHPTAVRGHNAGMVFLGRRVFESYLLLFLTSSSALTPDADFDHIVSRVVNTYVVGEHVGPTWGLGRVIAWTPTIPAEMLNPKQDQTDILKSAGLWKVQGDGVFAVLGGIYFQWGGSVAHRVFHTRILPNLLLPGTSDGLPDVFHEDVRRILQDMGGKKGPLLHPFKRTRDSEGNLLPEEEEEEDVTGKVVEKKGVVRESVWPRASEEERVKAAMGSYA